MIINTPDLEKAKTLIRKTTSKPIIVKAQTDSFNRKILEYGRFQTLLLTPIHGSDKSKSLDSGLNHIMAKIAVKNKIAAIAIDLKEISSLSPKQKAQTLARIKQNLKICRKAKCSLIAINSKSTVSTSSLLTTLGASSQQAKEAISF